MTLDMREAVSGKLLDGGVQGLDHAYTLQQKKPLTESDGEFQEFFFKLSGSFTAPTE
jgi:hypothetical protein